VEPSINPRPCIVSTNHKYSISSSQLIDNPTWIFEMDLSGDCEALLDIGERAKQLQVCCAIRTCYGIVFFCIISIINTTTNSSSPRPASHLPSPPLPKQSHHEKQRIKLELDIEEHPLESSFSSSLVSLMQKEEIAASQQNYEAHGQYADRVDLGLKTETKRHCSMQASSNKRRWVELLEIQAAERKQFNAQVSKKFYTSEACKRSPPAFTLEESLAREERRLQRDQFLNWERYETFNLENSFDLQLARVDAEWAVYEQQMLSDFESQKSNIMGKRKKLLSGNTRTEASGPWKSKEKQSRLFNTAPVFSPTGGNNFNNPNSPGANSRVQQQQQAAINSELANLDLLYQQGKDRIASQKRNAVRWISRQKARMMCQVESVGAVRIHVSGYYTACDRELDELHLMIKKNMMDTPPQLASYSHSQSESKNFGEDAPMVTSRSKSMTSQSSTTFLPLTPLKI